MSILTYSHTLLRGSEGKATSVCSKTTTFVTNDIITKKHRLLVTTN